MVGLSLSVRQAGSSDIDLICNYWFTASEAHLRSMGVEPSKMMDRADLERMLEIQLALPIQKRNSMCYIWEVNEEPIGHCNSNPTLFGSEAKMHLHIWIEEFRRSGIGLTMLKMTIPRFFNELQLNQLICEPYAKNEAPNKTLAKAGFKCESEYVTSPGGHSFEQPVKRWVLSKEKFHQLYSTTI